jgi:hypothetical protein
MGDGGKGSKPRPFSVPREVHGANHEAIFGKYIPPYLRNRTEETMQVRVKENTNEFGKCGCGRSPTGKCIGWHGLNEDQYKEALEKYLTNQEDLDGNTV